MEYLLGIIAALLGGIFYYRNKAKKSEIEAMLKETKVKDEALKQEEKLIEDAIAALDAGIQAIKKEKEEAAEKRKNMTLKERKEEAKNRYKK